MSNTAGILSACVHFIITGGCTEEATADVEAILVALEEDKRVLDVSVSISVMFWKESRRTLLFSERSAMTKSLRMQLA